MTIDEEMAWEDYQGFPRSTRQLYLCNKCGKRFVTRELYISHIETCDGKRDYPFKKKQTEYEIKRQKELAKSLEELHKKMGVK